ncbi:hypothetical protein Tco_0839936 [Tanacetum coccineum]|uniref:Uncharacterized protein n=1 Tax=Tanacetum coccineum TaxID=301880 RepID=A0ABQ5AWK5_9ASTR
MPLRDPNIYVRVPLKILDASLLYIRTARDLVSKDKMKWCGEVGGVEADLSPTSNAHQSQLEGTGSSVGTAEGSAEARCSSYSLSSSSFSTSSSSLSSSDDSLS